MPDRRNPESLEAIAATDQLLDAIADRRRMRPADRADAELFAMLEDWRDGIRGPAVHRVVTEDDAAAALADGLAARHSAQPKSRRLTLVASAAAAVLAIGGVGALVGGAQPGDSLYGLRTSLFGESQSVRDDRVTLAAQTEMAEVQEMIDRGEWERAQAKLQAVSTSVEEVGNVENKTELVQQWNELSVKVGTRDANATLPVVAPGEPAVPPPPGVTLLEVPVVTPPPTSAVTATTTAEPTTSEEPATTTATPTTSSEPAETTSETTSETTGATTSESSAETTTESSEPSETSAETSAQVTEQTSTVAPTTTAAPTTTVARTTAAPGEEPIVEDTVESAVENTVEDETTQAPQTTTQRLPIELPIQIPGIG